MAEGEGKLYTLTEVAKRTRISMPTLQRYKKMFNDRIPSSGDGRLQRYPESAIEIFNQLKNENSKKRGRPRKNAAAEKAGLGLRRITAPAPAAAAEEASAGAGAERPTPRLGRPPGAAKKSEERGKDGWMSLKDIEDATRISYPTLLRYLRMSPKRIPHKGSGRKRSFPPEAVAIFKTLREESRRGRKPGSGKKAQVAPPVAKPRPTPAGPPRVSASAAALANAPKRRGRPPKNPAAAVVASPGGPAPAVAADPGLANQVRELSRTVSLLQKQIAQLEAEIKKPIKVVLSR